MGSGGLRLCRERLGGAGRGRAQDIAIERGLDLRGEHIERAGERRDEDERADEEPGIEVQPANEGLERGHGRRLCRVAHGWVAFEEAEGESMGSSLDAGLAAARAVARSACGPAGDGDVHERRPLV